jgi:hypothetical protein
LSKAKAHAAGPLVANPSSMKRTYLRRHPVHSPPFRPRRHHALRRVDLFRWFPRPEIVRTLWCLWSAPRRPRRA